MMRVALPCGPASECRSDRFQGTFICQHSERIGFQADSICTRIHHQAGRLDGLDRHGEELGAQLAGHLLRHEGRATRRLSTNIHYGVRVRCITLNWRGWSTIGLARGSESSLRACANIDRVSYVFTRARALR